MLVYNNKTTMDYIYLHEDDCELRKFPIQYKLQNAHCYCV